MPDPIPNPWNAFLRGLDESIGQPVSLVCIGGFVVAMLYGLERPTADLDFIECRPGAMSVELLEIAGEGSRLHRKHGVFLQFVTVAQLPDNYEDRLVGMFDGEFDHLQLYGLGPYDLALSKLERNSEKDRDDVLLLASTEGFDLKEFGKIYREEFETYVEDRLFHRKTFEFWLELITERNPEVD